MTMIETVRKYLWICITVDSGWKTVLGINNSERESFCSGKFYSITCLGIEKIWCILIVFVNNLTERVNKYLELNRKFLTITIYVCQDECNLIY